MVIAVLKEVLRLYSTAIMKNWQLYFKCDIMFHKGIKYLKYMQAMRKVAMWSCDRVVY